MHVLAQWAQPNIDYHALAPEIVLACAVVVVLVLDLVLDERRKWLTGSVAGLGLLASLIPVATLAIDDGPARVLFGGAYVVDDFSLVVKALFLLAGYVVILMSTTYVDEGDYYQGEYYFLLLTSVLGMVMMSSSRDLISMFVALEFLSIPAYMLAAWRKRDIKSNEAGVKYFLLGVFASAVMLYGMSLLYGIADTTQLSGIQAYLAEAGTEPIAVLAIVFIIVGFAFKVSAVPFHTWAPDTYEGAPTPVTAFLSVASKAAGFVALVQLVFVAFPSAKEVWQPLFWVLAAITMTLGNLVALRQTNIVRMLAYSSIAQGGFILMPLAVVGESEQARTDALTAVVTYLIVYAAMNLGAFAVILAVTRKTRSGDISSFGGLFDYAPGLAVLMTMFLFSLAGIPPLGGWIAKFSVFKALLSAGGGWAVTLAVIGGVNSVIALYYYANVARQMWMEPAPDGDTTPIRIPQPLVAALGITAVATLLLGVLPNLVLRFGDLGQIVTWAGP
ncbi:MAG TPA: NADH-quinone oxidoreductase subunit N [Acidimicrobiales bacterium]